MLPLLTAICDPLSATVGHCASKAAALLAILCFHFLLVAYDVESALQIAMLLALSFKDGNDDADNIEIAFDVETCRRLVVDQPAY